MSIQTCWFLSIITYFRKEGGLGYIGNTNPSFKVNATDSLFLKMLDVLSRELNNVSGILVSKSLTKPSGDLCFGPSLSHREKVCKGRRRCE